MVLPHQGQCRHAVRNLTFIWRCWPRTFSILLKHQHEQCDSSFVESACGEYCPAQGGIQLHLLSLLELPVHEERHVCSQAVVRAVQRHLAC